MDRPRLTTDSVDFYVTGRQGESPERVVHVTVEGVPARQLKEKQLREVVARCSQDALGRLSGEGINITITSVGAHRVTYLSGDSKRTLDLRRDARPSTWEVHLQKLPKISFIAQGRSADKTRFVQVSVEPAALRGKTERQVREAVTRSAQEALKERAHENVAITIKAIVSEEVIYQEGSQIRTALLKPDEAGPSWEVRLMKTSPEIQEKQVTWGKLHHRLVKQWNVKNPVMGFFAKYVGAPLLATWDFLHQENGKKEAVRSLNKLVDALTPSTPEKFRHLLQRRRAGLQRLGDSVTTAQLTDAIDRSKEILKAASVGNLPKLSFRYAVEMAKKKTGELPMILPTGYYDQEGTFIPVLLSFYRKENNHIIVEQHGFPRGNGKVVTSAEYDLGEEPNALLIEEILVLQLPPEARASVDSRRRGQRKVIEARAAASPAPSEPKIAPGSEHERIGETFRQFGGVPLEIEGSMTPKTASAKDPWEQLARTVVSDIETGVPEERLQYALDIVNEEVTLLTSALATLKPEERRRALEDLRQRLASLRKEIDRHFGSLKAYEELVRSGFLREKIDKATRWVETQLKEQSLGLQEMIREGKKVEEPQGLPITVPLRGGTQVTAAEPTTNVVAAHQPQIKALQNAIATRQMAPALATMQALAHEIDQLVNVKNYTEAIELAEAVQALLPLPTPSSKDGSDFWNALLNQADGWNAIDAWGKTLSDIGKYEWESMIHLHPPSMTPRQLLNGVQARALFVKFARMKSTLAQRKACQYLRDHQDDLKSLELDTTRDLDRFAIQEIKQSREEAARLSKPPEATEAVPVQVSEEEKEAELLQSWKDLFDEDLAAKSSEKVAPTEEPPLRVKDLSDDELAHMVRSRLYTKEGILDYAPQLKLTYDEAASLVFDHYRADSRQIKELIHFHPFFRMGGDPALDRRLCLLEEFFISCGDKNDGSGGAGLPNSPLIRLDAKVGAPRTYDDMKEEAHASRRDAYFSSSDDLYSQELDALKALYHEDVTGQHPLGEGHRPLAGPGRFPNEIIDLQRHYLMFQTQLHPEFGLSLYFSPGMEGLLKAFSWFQGMENKASRETSTPEEAKKYVIQEAYRELFKQIDTMGRLEIESARYVTPDQPPISLTAYCKVERAVRREAALWGVSVLGFSGQ